MPTYQLGDRVTSNHPTQRGESGTVVGIVNYNVVQVLFDNGTSVLFAHSNLKLENSGDNQKSKSKSKMHTLPRINDGVKPVSVGTLYNPERVRLAVGNSAVELTESEVDDLIVMLEFQKGVNNGTIKI